ncbi:MAG TPA: hypothetical protein PK970_03920 [Hyphomicrobiaceae bacterium]|nr:hypothetical protein [Hyphomicrobiaceae bacterium]
MVLKWRKKPQGFDWNEYVRTTIKLRRDQRRARVEDIRANIADQARQVGVAAAKGVKAGASGAGNGVVAALKTVSSALARVFAPVASGVETAGLWLYLQLSRPSFALPLVLCGAITVFSGLYGAVLGPDTGSGSSSTLVVAGIALLIAALPSILTGFGFDVVDGDGVAARLVQRFAVSMAAMMIVGGGAWLYTGSRVPSGLAGPQTWIGSVVGGLSSLPPVEGRATVLAGDLLRIGSSVFKLSGIEAPDPQQICERDVGSRKWKCGQAALMALEKSVSGKTVRCVGFRPADQSGLVEARCDIGGVDLAESQVRNGHVFAVSQFLGGYAALEQEAKAGQRGIWSGKVEHPADYRARIWEMAKRASPDGCPIKGQVTNSGKSYVLPWSPNYSRIAVQIKRGERWFCSEDEAISAGWRAAGRT